MLPRLDRHALLVTDANAAYRVFSRQHGIAHEAISLRVGVRLQSGMSGAIHVENVNGYHGRSKAWHTRFHGVASRY